eukprot:GEMP01000198.1.p1 GENE.GEMP01000198.1~~GEMP01000198.1.p1  ORF type:complete len:2519 (-),score=194.83 GEMP01000198.1:416-7972(-)
MRSGLSAPSPSQKSQYVPTDSASDGHSTQVIDELESATAQPVLGAELEMNTQSFLTADGLLGTCGKLPSCLQPSVEEFNADEEKYDGVLHPVQRGDLRGASDTDGSRAPTDGIGNFFVSTPGIVGDSSLNHYDQLQTGRTWSRRHDTGATPPSCCNLQLDLHNAGARPPGVPANGGHVDDQRTSDADPFSVIYFERGLHSPSPNSKLQESYSPLDRTLLRQEYLDRGSTDVAGTADDSHTSLVRQPHGLATCSVGPPSDRQSLNHYAKDSALTADPRCDCGSQSADPLIIKEKSAKERCCTAPKNHNSIFSDPSVCNLGESPLAVGNVLTIKDASINEEPRVIPAGADPKYITSTSVNESVHAQLPPNNDRTSLVRKEVYNAALNPGKKSGSMHSGEIYIASPTQTRLGQSEKSAITNLHQDAEVQKPVGADDGEQTEDLLDVESCRTYIHRNLHYGRTTAKRTANATGVIANCAATYAPNLSDLVTMRLVDEDTCCRPKKKRMVDVNSERDRTIPHGTCEVARADHLDAALELIEHILPVEALELSSDKLAILSAEVNGDLIQLPNKKQLSALSKRHSSVEAEEEKSLNEVIHSDDCTASLLAWRNDYTSPSNVIGCDKSAVSLTLGNSNGSLHRRFDSAHSAGGHRGGLPLLPCFGDKSHPDALMGAIHSTANNARRFPEDSRLRGDYLQPDGMGACNTNICDMDLCSMDTPEQDYLIDQCAEPQTTEVTSEDVGTAGPACDLKQQNTKPPYESAIVRRVQPVDAELMSQQPELFTGEARKHNFAKKELIAHNVDKYRSSVVERHGGSLLNLDSGLELPKLGYLDEKLTPKCGILEETEYLRSKAEDTLKCRADWHSIDQLLVTTAAALMYYVTDGKARDRANVLNTTRVFTIVMGSFTRAHVDGLFICRNGVWSKSELHDVQMLVHIESCFLLAKSFARKLSADNVEPLTHSKVTEHLIHTINVEAVEYLTQQQIKKGGIVRTLDRYYEKLADDGGRGTIANFCTYLVTSKEAMPIACYEDGCISIDLGDPFRQMRRSPSNNCYTQFNLRLSSKYSENSVQRLKAFLATFYYTSSEDCAESPEFKDSPGLLLDLSQEALILGGRSPQMPHAVIIYIGSGQNGKTSRFVLRCSVLGNEQGGIMDSSLLFTDEEFRITAGNHVGHSHITIDESMDGAIKSSVLKNLVGRGSLLVRPPYAKNSQQITWNKCGFWWNMNKVFRINKDGVKAWTRRCKFVLVRGEYTHKAENVNMEQGVFLADNDLEALLASPEAAGIYHTHILLPFMKKFNEQDCRALIDEPPITIRRLTEEKIAEAMGGANFVCGANVGNHNSTIDGVKIRDTLIANWEHRLWKSRLQYMTTIPGKRVERKAKFEQIIKDTKEDLFVEDGPSCYKIVIPNLEVDVDVMWKNRGKLSYTEIIDLDSLTKFAADKEKNNRRPLETHRFLQIHLKAPHGVEVGYYYKYAEFNGRRISRGDSLTHITREARWAAMGNILIGIDIRNCYPTLIVQVLRRILPNMQFPALEDYASNSAIRQLEVAEFYGLPMAAVKRLFIRVMNGGEIASADDDEQRSISSMVCAPEFLIIYKKQCSMAIRAIEQANHRLTMHFRDEDRKCAPLTTASYVLQSIEDGVLQVIEGVVQRANGSVVALCNDEVIINRHRYVGLICKESEREALLIMGYHIRLALHDPVSDRRKVEVIEPIFDTEQRESCILNSLGCLFADSDALRTTIVSVAEKLGSGPHYYRDVQDFLRGSVTMNGIGEIPLMSIPEGLFIIHSQGHAVPCVSTGSTVTLYSNTLPRFGDVCYIIEVNQAEPPIAGCKDFLEFKAGGDENANAVRQCAPQTADAEEDWCNQNGALLVMLRRERLAYSKHCTGRTCSLCVSRTFERPSRLVDHISTYHGGCHGVASSRQLKLVKALYDNDELRRLARMTISHQPLEHVTEGNYIKQSAELMRKWLQDSPHFNSLKGKVTNWDDYLSLVITKAGGPKFFFKADAEAAGFKRLNRVYVDDAFLSLVLGSSLNPQTNGCQKTLYNHLIQHFLSECADAPLLLPSTGHVLLDIQSAAFGDFPQISKNLVMLRQLGELQRIAIDGTFKTCMSILGQRKHGSPLERPNDGDVAETHVVLTVTTKSGCVIGAQPMYSENAMGCLRAVRTIMGQHVECVEIIVSDRARDFDVGDARSMFPSLKAICADPLHRVFETEAFFGEHKTDLSGQLRLIHSKFTCGAECHGDGSQLISGPYYAKTMESSARKRLSGARNPVLTTRLSRHKALVVLGEIKPDAHFGSFAEYSLMIESLIEAYSEHMSRRNRKQRTLRSVLQSCLLHDNFQYLVNNAKYLVRNGIADSSLVTTGTTCNEATHYQLKAWQRNIIEQSPERHSFMCRMFVLMRMASWISARLCNLSCPFGGSSGMLHRILGAYEGMSRQPLRASADTPLKSVKHQVSTRATRRHGLKARDPIQLTAKQKSDIRKNSRVGHAAKVGRATISSRKCAADSKRLKRRTVFRKATKRIQWSKGKCRQ